MAPRQRFTTTGMNDNNTPSTTSIMTSTTGITTTATTTNRQQHPNSSRNTNDDGDVGVTNDITQQEQEEKPLLALDSNLSNDDSINTAAITTKTNTTTGKDSKATTTSINRVEVSLLSTKVTTTTVIPTTNTDAAERAREHHDFFNLLVLPFVVGATFINWDLTKLLQGPTEAYIGKHFWLNWGMTLLYFVSDLLWVSLIPLSVKSPGLIIKHHIAAIAYLACPIAFPDFEWMMGAMLTVEFNTWFLILRRVAFKRHDIAFFTPLVHSIIAFLFYSSWIIVRIIIYPAILIHFLSMTPIYINFERDGRFIWHNEFIVPPIHLTLVLMNLKWSYDLFKPFFVKSSNDHNGNKKTVSDGL